jgi:cytochrome c peroxidase
MVGEDATVCSNCHQIRPHPGVDHSIHLKGEKLARKDEYEKRHKVSLPLTPDGRIKCSTCHNPHAKGVLKGGAGVGAGSRWRVPDFREMCAPCHGRY